MKNMKHYKFKLNGCWQSVKIHKESGKESDSDYIFRKLTANVREASLEETAEILNAIENLSDDDMAIVAAERFY